MLYVDLRWSDNRGSKGLGTLDMRKIERNHKLQILAKVQAGGKKLFQEFGKLNCRALSFYP